jgi:hypothetical protein
MDDLCEQDYEVLRGEEDEAIGGCGEEGGQEGRQQPEEG